MSASELVIDTDPVPDELQDGGVVIEAGAYEGRWTKKVCEQRTGCMVYAFEPATRAYKVAKEKLEGCQGVVLRCVALGKQEGTAILYDIMRDGANTGWTDIEPHETVPVVDVAQVVETLGEIDLAHFNAEGGEVDILERLLDTGLIGRVRTILVQWHRYDDEMRARVVTVVERLQRTHELEKRRFWGCWKIKDAS